MATGAEGAPAVRVLYIAGSGRSGSTILDRTLGQVDGFFSAGELCNLWGRGLLARRGPSADAFTFRAPFPAPAGAAR